jgi:hypothetical protein
MNPALPPLLQELFDRGVDPLDDATARAWLEQHPEHLRAFAALRATLREVAGVPPRTAWPLRRWPFLLVAGAAAVLLGVVAWWPTTATVPAPAPTVLPRPLFAPRSCVLSITTTERIADDTRAFAVATVQGTLSRQASTTFSTSPTVPRLPTVFLRTTVLEETIRP